MTIMFIIKPCPYQYGKKHVIYLESIKLKHGMIYVDDIKFTSNPSEAATFEGEAADDAASALHCYFGSQNVATKRTRRGRNRRHYDYV